MWMGKPAKNAPVGSNIPAWSFVLELEHDVGRVKGVLTKVIYETNMQADIERDLEREEDIDYIQS